MVFPAVSLYIPIFKVIKDTLRESINSFLYKVWNILSHRNARRACTRFFGKHISVWRPSKFQLWKNNWRNPFMFMRNLECHCISWLCYWWKDLDILIPERHIFLVKKYIYRLILTSWLLSRDHFKLESSFYQATFSWLCLDFNKLEFILIRVRFIKKFDQALVTY